MIKFFRKIRQKLLAENKFSKYLIYAIGEIVLVVIGILIALQVNNANEAHKTNAEIDLVYKNIRQEFIENQDELKGVLQNLHNTMNGCREVLSLIGSTEYEFNQPEIDSIIQVAFLWPLWRPSTFTVNDVKNSGKLSFLKNTNIKKLLFEWERLTEYIDNQNIRVENGSLEIINYINKNASLRNINYKTFSLGKSKLKFDNAVLLDDLVFENLINSKLGYTTYLELFYNQANELISKILVETEK